MSPASSAKREPFFLDTPAGRRLGIATRPPGPPAGGLLYIHPFAEEMNKSRRMAALGAAAFAERGWLVLQLDLHGCGDSAGDFGDATWETWLDDMSAAWQWLRERCSGPIALWTLRAGSLVAADWLARGAERPPWLLWQPVANGQQHLTQFLRLKAASEMRTASEGASALSRLRAELDAGRAVEVAGYRLSPGLARGLAGATLAPPAGYGAPVAMLEVASAEGATPSPAIAALADKWRQAGVPATAEVARGPTFWQTQLIETAPGLIDASVPHLERLRA